jgi:hypothetical protein
MTYANNHALAEDASAELACTGAKPAPASVDWAGRLVAAAWANREEVIAREAINEDPERWDGLS